MKSTANSLLIIALMITLGCAADPSHRPLPYEKMLLVAVSDVQNQTGNREYDPLLGGLAGNISEELYQTNCFRVLERQKLKSLVEEMKNSMTGPSDPGGNLAVGKMAGAEAMLFVNLAAVKYSADKDSTFFAQNVREEIETIMNARLVAVETGEILAASKVSIPYTNRYRSFCFFKDGEKADQKLVVQQSLEKAGRQLAREMARQVSKRGR